MNEVEKLSERIQQMEDGRKKNEMKALLAQLTKGK